MDLGPTTGSSTASPILASDDFTESAAWTVETEISANDVVEKEKLVREIMAMQDGLRALISRVNAVKEDCKKAEADNEMLQTYIDSVTKSLAAKERG
ncbi:hypothetical protein NDA11_005351 [Ustilago hordei]|uniref:Short coiled-coil protein n=1 Tax=Ustilago hordei TaxID=120017 RepID=I2FW16_USTHO|nr:hypothetical protein NDA10_002635 [Ustilago hordei]SOV01452.1 uncharacterized protein UDID_00970 [Ustilago sp. UG-2017a]SPC63670.1 uncharacterized protein UHOD_00970 [Ustilago sp. UG-2017b]KAJ1570897.1 hypothetical protein NDA11_005351 [Ustilago hordei]KAJ1587016.1 hypothetical protein NDA15_001178 [Ustilago hordei]